MVNSSSTYLYVGCYTSRSAEMDDILADFDLFVTNSQSNAGARPSRPQAWAKNVIGVGGFLHRGNTNPSYAKPWHAPTDDLDRANLLSQLDGALMHAQNIAKSLGMATDDYETSIVCVRDRARQERDNILNGCRL